MFHAGGIEVGWQWAQPMYIASAAERFPTVKMIMAHAGCESWQQAMWACRHLPNAFMDISIYQWEFVMFPEKFYRWLREIVDEVTPWRVLFASDAPYPNTMVALPEWVDAIKNPKTSSVKFTQEEMEIILGKGAEQVWDLSPMTGKVPGGPLKNEYGR
jgi:predicted TIM-barrel fold metal-dependent hydrolase